MDAGAHLHQKYCLMKKNGVLQKWFAAGAGKRATWKERQTASNSSQVLTLVETEGFQEVHCEEVRGEKSTIQTKLNLSIKCPF